VRYEVNLKSEKRRKGRNISKKNIVKAKIEDIKLDYAQDIQPCESSEQKMEIEKKIV
jgi:hypothetical protein